MTDHQHDRVGHGDARRAQRRLHQVGADLERGGASGRSSRTTSSARMPDGALIDRARFLERHGAARDDQQSRGARRERPPHGRLRDRARPDDVYDGGREGRIGPLHGRVGASRRTVAGRVSARDAQLTTTARETRRRLPSPRRVLLRGASAPRAAAERPPRAAVAAPIGPADTAGTPCPSCPTR